MILKPGPDGELMVQATDSDDMLMIEEKDGRLVISGWNEDGEWIGDLVVAEQCKNPTCKNPRLHLTEFHLDQYDERSKRK